MGTKEIEGLEGEKSKLFYEYLRILREVKPKYFLLENVKMKKQSEEELNKYMGVEGLHINSELVTFAKRPRIYWTNIPEVEKPKDKKISFQSFKDTDPEYCRQFKVKRTHLVLDYKLSERPAGRKEMRADADDFLQEMRKLYKSLGLVFKYIHVMEIGKKGALHHHLVINTPDEVSQRAITKAWKGRGRTHFNPLDDSGNYAKLASYLIKQSDGMLKDPDALQGKRWNSSKNLRKPTILRKEPIKDKGWYNRIARLPKKLEKSYCLDGDSVREGIHEKTRQHEGISAIAKQYGRNGEIEALYPCTVEGITVDDAGLLKSKLRHKALVDYRIVGSSFTDSGFYEDLLIFKGFTMDGINTKPIREIVKGTIEGQIKAQNYLNTLYDNGLTNKLVVQLTYSQNV